MRHAIGIWILVFVALYVAVAMIRLAYPRLSWTRERRARRIQAQWAWRRDGRSNSALAIENERDPVRIMTHRCCCRLR